MCASRKKCMLPPLPSMGYQNRLKFQYPIFVRHKFSCPHLPILQNQQLKVKLFMKKDVGVIDTQSHIK